MRSKVPKWSMHNYSDVIWSHTSIRLREMVPLTKGEHATNQPVQHRLAEAERTELEARARRYTSPYSDVVRARIVLYAAEGLGNDEIAARLDTPRQVVSKWRKRFYDERLVG